MYIAVEMHADLSSRVNVVCNKAIRANLVSMFDLTGFKLGYVFSDVPQAGTHI